MLIRGRRNSVTLTFAQGGVRVEAATASIDLAVAPGADSVHFTAWVNRRSPLAWRATPAEARAYAARIVRAADAAEAQARGEG